MEYEKKKKEKRKKERGKNFLRPDRTYIDLRYKVTRQWLLFWATMAIVCACDVGFIHSFIYNYLHLFTFVWCESCSYRTVFKRVACSGKAIFMTSRFLQVILLFVALG